MTPEVERLPADHPGICGAAGCREDVEYVVDHPVRGEIYVCEADAEPYPVLRRVKTEEVSA